MFIFRRWPGQRDVVVVLHEYQGWTRGLLQNNLCSVINDWRVGTIYVGYIEASFPFYTKRSSFQSCGLFPRVSRVLCSLDSLQESHSVDSFQECPESCALWTRCKSLHSHHVTYPSSSIWVYSLSSPVCLPFWSNDLCSCVPRIWFVTYIKYVDLVLKTF